MPRNSPSTINMSVSRFYRMCNSIDNLLWLRLPSTCYQYARCKQWIFQLMRFRLRELTEAYRWNLSSIIQLELWDVRCHGSAVWWWFGRYHLYRLSGPPQFRYPVPSDRGCRLSNAPVYMHGSQTTASAFNHHSYVFTWFVNCRMCWLKHHLQHMSRSCGIWHYKQRCPCIQTNNLLETSQELKKMQEIGGEWKR